MPDTATLKATKPKAKIEHFDVLIVGAGISGVGAAYHLKTQTPKKKFVVLESYESFGGTWHLHRYPGIRSDSDLYTFGYRHKPWVGPPIASRDEILKYMEEVIAENDLAPHIRYRHRITSASWSTAKKKWTVKAERLDTGEVLTFTAKFLWMCQGYYKHEQGYTPEWPGMESFRGQIVHPQHWPEDLDLTGKKVVCIGSGATAATVVPAIAGKCEHVTLLQRSPTYFIPARNENLLADELRMLQVDENWIHEIVRRKYLFEQGEFTRRSFEDAEALRIELLDGVKAFLPENYDMKHFTPSYRPWQQRVAFVPDADLFEGIKAGKASVVTDHIERFTETGIQLKSGAHLEADVIVTATGFTLSVFGGIPFTVDGKAVDWADTITYRGMMFTGVPNMIWVFGYFRASWTLRVDLLGDFVARLLKHMDSKGVKQVEAVMRPQDHNMEILPWMDPDNFNAGYLMRAMDQMPKRGANPEWQHNQNYWDDKDAIPLIDLDAPEFRYS
jgi:cation diffusion facilitator CzcD-associated flavoprotein CzcO